MHTLVSCIYNFTVVDHAICLAVENETSMCRQVGPVNNGRKDDSSESSSSKNDNGQNPSADTNKQRFNVYNSLFVESASMFGI